MRLALCEAPTLEQPQHRELRALLFFDKCVGSITSHRILEWRNCETGPPAYSPYPRRLESLTICWCNYKGSTFSSVRPELNSRPPARQPDAQPTEPPVAVRITWLSIILRLDLISNGNRTDFVFHSHAPTKLPFHISHLANLASYLCAPIFLNFFLWFCIASSFRAVLCKAKERGLSV